MMNRRNLLARAGAIVPLTALASLAACSKEEAVTSTASAATPAATAPAAKLSAAQQLELAATGSGFTIGPVMAANTVYVFFDSQCPHCAQLWQASSEVGSRFRMQWMPVAFMAKISQPQGAAIISAKDPSALMSQNEALVLARKGGLDITTLTPPADALAKVMANTELLNKLGADSVPMIYFKNQRTGEAGSHSGTLLIQQMLEIVGDA